MKKLCKREIFASEISEYLGVKWTRKDFNVTGPASPDSAGLEKFVFCSENKDLSGIADLLLIARKGSDCKGFAVIYVENPENAFYRIINEFFMDRKPPVIDQTADISPETKIARGVSVGKNTVIESGVIIGANSLIGSGVIIRANTTIGKNCIIKDNAVIGNEGYHFINDGDLYLDKPCLGSIIIGDAVLIGSNTSIELPLFDTTVVKSNTKIDDLVNIGSNCFIQEKVRIAAGSILCHRVKVGENSFIGAGAVIRDGVSIGADSIVGIGSVVLKDVCNEKRVAGNPAHEI